MASIIKILKDIPLDPRYEHTLSHSTWESQEEYFNRPEFQVYTSDNFTYLRKERAVKVAVPLDTLEENRANYCAIRNPGGKWRYYFIRNKVYVSDLVTSLDIELDVMQTYLHDFTLPPCVVEREHVEDDTPGKHLLDEGLELGEYVSNGGKHMTELNELALVVQSSVSLQNPMGETVHGGIINGVYSGLKLYTRTANALGATVLNAALSSLSTLGKADGVASIWLYPKALIQADWDNENDQVMLEVKGMTQMVIQSTRSSALDGYIPRNNKLLTFPYKFIHCSNNMGESGQYKYEYFADPAACVFRFGGSCTNDGIVRMIPENYRNYAKDNESGLSLGGFPTCAWTQDAYKIWLAQNANTQALTIQDANVQGAVGAGKALLGVGMGLGGLIAGGPAGLAVAGAAGAGSNITSGVSSMYSAYMQVNSLYALRRDHAVQPPQAKGVQSASCNVALGTHTFSFTNMSISADYAERIDQFFDMFGYAVNKVKEPKYLTRSIWNYIKTVGCVVEGPIDANDRRIIAAIFDKGITFWHDSDKIYRYDLADDNAITLG